MPRLMTGYLDVMAVGATKSFLSTASVILTSGPNTIICSLHFSKSLFVFYIVTCASQLHSRSFKEHNR